MKQWPAGVNSRFAEVTENDILRMQNITIPRIFLARMTAHGSDEMASRFPERLSEAQISEINEKAIPIIINKKKATKLVKAHSEF